MLTPGPLTTSLPTKAAMLRDWGSWDSAFNAVTAKVREKLVAFIRENYPEALPQTRVQLDAVAQPIPQGNPAMRGAMM